MGRMVVGGYAGGDLSIHLDDRTCRAFQDVILTQLATGKGLFCRYAGVNDNGDAGVTAVWIGPSASLRFEYEGDILPDVEQELASGFQLHIDKFGGIIMPSAAEMKQLVEENRAFEETSAATE